MRKWTEKEYSQWVYYGEYDGKIIGSVYKVGNTQGIWGAKVYNNINEGILGQYIDSDFAKKAVEWYWSVEDGNVIENQETQ
jgi:hypothetical protein